MTISRHEAGAVVAGQKAGGQFAQVSKSQADGAALAVVERPSLPDELVSELNDGSSAYDDLVELRRFLGENQDEFDVDYDLIFVDYDDRLRDEQIDSFLSGDHQAIDEHLDDLFYDARDEAAQSRATQIAERLGLEWDDLSVEAQDEMREFVEGCDTSEPLPQLAKNTPPQLMRAPIHDDITAGMRSWAEREGVDHQMLAFGDFEEAAGLRVKYLTEQLQTAGFNPDMMTDEDRTEIVSLATEGPYNWHEGVRLDVIWYGHIEDAAVPRDGTPKHLRFGGSPAFSRENATGKVRVVLLDTMNGSGYDAALSQPLTVTVTEDRPARLDSGGNSHGYGWDDAAGVYKPAYSVDVNATSLETEDAA